MSRFLEVKADVNHIEDEFQSEVLEIPETASQEEVSEEVLGDVMPGTSTGRKLPQPKIEEDLQTVMSIEHIEDVHDDKTGYEDEVMKEVGYSAASTMRALPSPNMNEPVELDVTIRTTQDNNEEDALVADTAAEHDNIDVANAEDNPENTQENPESVPQPAIDIPITEESMKTLMETLSSCPHQQETKKKQKKKKDDIFLEDSENFRMMRRTAFKQNEKNGKNGAKSGSTEMVPNSLNTLAPKFRDAKTALTVQKFYHNLSLIVQGLTSGLTVAEAVFAVNFATEELLLQGYRVMSLYVHATFMMFFSLGCVSSLDRLHYKGFGRSQILETLNQGAVLGAVLWFVGLITTVLTIEFDQLLSPENENPQLSKGLMLFWRICCCARALAAIAAWLLLALRQDKDLLAEKIEKNAQNEIKEEKDTDEQPNTTNSGEGNISTNPVHQENLKTEIK